MKHGIWIIALAAVAVTGCSTSEPEPVTGKVTGTIAYRERMMLTPEAVARVSLRDVSLADAPAKVLAEQEITNPGQVPIAFELEYALADIDESMSYSVHAVIHDRGNILFTTDTHAPVLTRGAGNEVDLMLVSVTRPPTVSPPAVPQAEPKGVEMSGMFRYMADAALFRDCHDNRTYPVSMEGAYIELERAYLNSGIEAGEELMVEVRGRLLDRPAMEGNTNEVKLIVDLFKTIYPEKSCTPPVDEPLANTYWKLLEVGDNPVTTPEGQKEAHMILSAEDSRVNGNAGCNNFFGSWESDGEKVTFGQMGSTMMACQHGMDTEQAFLAALGEANRHQISGLIMELYKDDQLLAKFEAIHF
jgi:uncharacterized lipoprotein YbaY/heat shock protein HslJ